MKVGERRWSSKMYGSGGGDEGWRKAMEQEMYGSGEGMKVGGRPIV